MKLKGSPPAPPRPNNNEEEKEVLASMQEPEPYVLTTPKSLSLLSQKGTSKSEIKKNKAGHSHTGKGMIISHDAAKSGKSQRSRPPCPSTSLTLRSFSDHLFFLPPLVSDHEYRTVKVFPRLASDALSFTERRKVIPRRIRKHNTGGSLASTRSVRSVMSELTKSPFEEGEADQGPLTSIRRNMMLKKREGRKGVLPAVQRRASVEAVYQKIKSHSALDKAKHKLKKAAKHYDRYKDGEVLTKSFADYHMGPSEFRMQMRRAMGVDLTRKEAEALHSHADRDKSGSLDGAEFLLMFFKEAHEEHSTDLQKRLKLKELRVEKEKQKKIQEENDRVRADYSCFTTSFTAENIKRVMRRLARHAFEFDVTSEQGKRTSKNFQCILRPAALKEQLFKSFHMKVTKAELGALIDQFDSDGDGDVSGAEFMVTFSKLGQIARRNEKKKREQIMNRKLQSGLVLPLLKPSLGR